MKIELVVAVMIVSMAVYAQQMSMRLFTTDNIFMSSDKYLDGGVEWGFSAGSRKGIMEVYIDGSVYLPFINYELISFPYNAGVVANWLNTQDIVLSSNMYIAGQWHPGYYYENTFEMPGLYNYIEFNPSYMISISAYNDAYAEIYNIIHVLNRITDRQYISLQVFLPWRIALHLNARGGWMYMYNENIRSSQYMINPVISAGITDNIGIYSSGSKSFVSDRALPYYYDDSFIDDFFYNEESLSGGITLVDIIAEKIQLSFIYSEMDYVELISDSASVNDLPPVDSFNNTNRNDRIWRINASVTYAFDRKPYTVSYEYENRISTNEYYTCNTHYLDLYFDF